MTRFLLAASLSLCAALAQADGIAQLKQFVHDTRALSARFSQTVSGDKPLHVSGTLELQRPGRFRWTYDTPYEQLIVGDGSRLWVQVAVRPVSTAERVMGSDRNRSTTPLVRSVFRATPE